MSKYNFKINGKDYAVSIDGIEGRQASVTVNGIQYSVELENAVPAQPLPRQAAAPASATAAAPAAPSPAANSGGPASPVCSPLPGVIISIDVKEGQKVSKGQKVAVLEAMKMENEIQADKDGTVASILVQKGDSVLEGAQILTIA